MKTRSIVVVALLAIALIGGIAFSQWFGPDILKLQAELGSDAGRIKGTMRVAGDNYLGYWFITSQEFTHRLRQQGYAIRWTNDGGNYAERHKNFAKSDYDIMVLPISSYLQHGLAYQYPGLIPVAISESKGADSIVGYKEKVVRGANREPTVNDLNNPSLHICVTPDSPSSFLLNIAIVHFALDDLKSNGAWRVETNGSQEAYKKLLAKECDVAVVWEPDVSKALAIPGVTTLFGSDQVSEMIIDVFAIRRQMTRDNPEMVSAFFRAYFDTLVYYETRKDQLLQDMQRNSEFSSREALEKAIARIDWFSLYSQCGNWFGIDVPGVAQAKPQEKIVDAISSITKVMTTVGDISGDPLGGNPYKITSRDVLAGLCKEIAPETPGFGVPQVVQQFGALSDEEWTKLKILGRLRVNPVLFSAGTSRLTREGAEVIDEVAKALIHNYPQYRVYVRGHTAPVGDEAANARLSQERAEVVKNYLETIHGIDSNRLKAQGIGSKEPLSRTPGEGELSYRNRLPRVEFVLAEDKK